MIKILIGIADSNLEADLRSIVAEIEGSDIVGVARTTLELGDFVGRFSPDVILADENLGPEPTHQFMRDLSVRMPGAALLQVSGDRANTTVIRAMEAGARGVIAYPFAYEDVQSKINSAAEWAQQMQGILAGAAAAASGSRARVITFVGAKGGVGVTTLVTHLAIDHVNRQPGHRVVVVDLDIEKGDVSAVLEVRQAVSIADVAKVHRDLAVSTVMDALIHHETGIHLLLAPVDVRQGEVVTPEAIRPIIALLRREFDLILIDAGGYVSPAQAAAVEIGDEVVVVTTADVLSVRAMRKRILAWEALGVKREGELKVLINRTDKTAVFPASAVAQLTTARVLDVRIPSSPRVLEPAINERDPRAVSEVAWWRLLTDLRAELGLEAAVTAQRQAAPVSVPVSGTGQVPEVKRSRAKRFRQRRPTAEAGQLALENASMIPLALLMALIAWQVGVIGLTFIWSGRASSAAAREYAVSGSLAQSQLAAKEALPTTFASGLTVTASGPSEIMVTLNIPAQAPPSVGLPQRLSASRSVVVEP